LQGSNGKNHIHIQANELYWDQVIFLEPGAQNPINIAIKDHEKVLTYWLNFN